MTKFGYLNKICKVVLRFFDRKVTMLKRSFPFGERLSAAAAGLPRLRGGFSERQGGFTAFGIGLPVLQDPHPATAEGCPVQRKRLPERPEGLQVTRIGLPATGRALSENGEGQSLSWEGLPTAEKGLAAMRKGEEER